MKKMYFMFLTLLLLGTVGAKAQVVIGADRLPAAGAILELTSTDNRVLLLPRVTNAQRAGLSTPGLIIFNTDDNLVQFCANGGQWKTVTTGPAVNVSISSGSGSSFTGVKISANDSEANNNDAILQLESSSKALLLPTVTTTTASKKGSLAFKDGKLCFSVADGGAWQTR